MVVVRLVQLISCFVLQGLHVVVLCTMGVTVSRRATVPGSSVLIFCKSDHFLVMLTASFSMIFFTVEHVGSNLPDFPTHWHSTERWATAFTHLEPALAALADLIICFREVPQVMFPGNRRHTAVAPRRWVLDCLCWLQCFFSLR